MAVDFERNRLANDLKKKFTGGNEITDAITGFRPYQLSRFMS